MTYTLDPTEKDLVRALRDVGFPQSKFGVLIGGNYRPQNDELIDQIRKDHFMADVLIYIKHNKSITVCLEKIGEGKYMWEALANLYLALKKV